MAWNNNTEAWQATVMASRASYARHNIERDVARKIERIRQSWPDAPESLAGKFGEDASRKPSGDEEHQALNWSDWRWHVENRLRLTRRSTTSDLAAVAALLGLSQNETSALAKVVFEGITERRAGRDARRYYDFSMLPLNMLLSPDVRSYFIPGTDYGTESEVTEPDPYGLVWAPTRAPVQGQEPSGVLIR